MGRYRAPVKPGSPFITEEGYQDLTDEYNHLWRVKRPEVVKALSEAAAEGDRSENAEYISRKRQLASIDYRVRYLQKRMPDLKVVKENPSDLNRVFFGAWITLLEENDTEITYRIVGPDEIHTQEGNISLDAPLARGLLGKGIDDIIEIKLPQGLREFEIIEIRYA